LISIWLTPSEEDWDYLQEIINDLAAEYSAPVFSPHCTLLSPVDLNKKELQSVLSNVSKEIAPIYVTMSGLNYSNNIWKTVFIKLEKSSELIALQKRVVGQSSPVQPYEFLPHLSLIYKEMTVELKEEIIRKLVVRNLYKMDKITAMRTRLDVTKWEKVAEVTLHA